MTATKSLPLEAEEAILGQETIKKHLIGGLQVLGPSFFI